VAVPAPGLVHRFLIGLENIDRSYLTRFLNGDLISAPCKPPPPPPPPPHSPPPPRQRESAPPLHRAAGMGEGAASLNHPGGSRRALLEHPGWGRGLYLLGHLRCCGAPSASFGSRGISHGFPPRKQELPCGKAARVVRGVRQRCGSGRGQAHRVFDRSELIRKIQVCGRLPEYGEADPWVVRGPGGGSRWGEPQASRFCGRAPAPYNRRGHAGQPVRGVGCLV
jgi:hypothetical protein